MDIFQATECGDLSRVRYLVEQGGNIEVTGPWNDTPLIRAAYRGQIDVVKYLVERGAKMTDGEGIVKMAKDRGFQEIANYLAEVIEQVSLMQDMTSL